MWKVTKMYFWRQNIIDLLAVINYTYVVGKERREVCRKSIEGVR